MIFLLQAKGYFAEIALFRKPIQNPVKYPRWGFLRKWLTAEFSFGNRGLTH